MAANLEELTKRAAEKALIKDCHDLMRLGEHYE